MKISFENMSVFITGGSRGIGKAIALAFIDSGCVDVTVTGQLEEPPSWLRSEDLGSKITYFSLDLTSENWVSKFEEFVENRHGFDICVNNAGINAIYDHQDFPKEKIKDILKVNLEAPIVISGILSKYMKANHYGRIINIGSIFGVVSKKKRSVYTASKAGLIGVTKTMAIELADWNILVNALSPGFIETDLTREILGAEGIEEMVEKVPLKRLGQPEEVANLTLFLASSQNSYVTGQNIVLDGGFVCE